MPPNFNVETLKNAVPGCTERPGVTVYLSSWEDQLPDGTVLEGRGVRPDTVVKTNLQDLKQSDAVLDAALKHLRGASGTKPTK